MAKTSARISARTSRPDATCEEETLASQGELEAPDDEETSTAPVDASETFPLQVCQEVKESSVNRSNEPSGVAFEECGVTKWPTHLLEDVACRVVREEGGECGRQEGVLGSAHGGGLAESKHGGEDHGESSSRGAWFELIGWCWGGRPCWRV